MKSIRDRWAVGLLSGLALGITLLSAGCKAPAEGTAGPQATEAPTPLPERSVESLITHVADNSGELTRLPPRYIYRRLHTRGDSQAIAAAFRRLRVGEMPDARAGLIDALESDFVHSPDTSSLDLLNPELSDHFREFDWHADDYVGGAEGPNEKLADMLTDSLDIVSPERRANRSRTAVVLREEATEAVWDYMLGQWTPVPGEQGHKLNRYAVAGYVAMREAAAADGVDLTILSAHRDPQQAKRNAARAANPYAVASFSSHSLGLAIDLALPRPDSGRFRLTTSPMSDVVAMRKSPVHKWLHLHGHKFGWFPFQHEPWHWEFNPPGFREVFFADFPDGPPDRTPDNPPDNPQD